MKSLIFILLIWVLSCAPRLSWTVMYKDINKYQAVTENKTLFLEFKDKNTIEVEFVIGSNTLKDILQYDKNTDSWVSSKGLQSFKRGSTMYLIIKEMEEDRGNRVLQH